MELKVHHKSSIWLQQTNLKSWLMMHHTLKKGQPLSIKREGIETTDIQTTWDKKTNLTVAGIRNTIPCCTTTSWNNIIVGTHISFIHSSILSVSFTLTLILILFSLGYLLFLSFSIENFSNFYFLCLNITHWDMSLPLFFSTQWNNIWLQL